MFQTNVADSTQKREFILHLFWSCMKLQDFWNIITGIFKEPTDFPIAEDPSFFSYLTSTDPSCSTFTTQPKLRWWDPTPLLVAMWLNTFEEKKSMKDHKPSSHNTCKTFHKTWFYFRFHFLRWGCITSHTTRLQNSFFRQSVHFFEC